MMELFTGKECSTGSGVSADSSHALCWAIVTISNWAPRRSRSRASDADGHRQAGTSGANDKSTLRIIAQTPARLCIVRITNQDARLRSPLVSVTIRSVSVCEYSRCVRTSFAAHRVRGAEDPSCVLNIRLSSSDGRTRDQTRAVFMREGVRRDFNDDITTEVGCRERDTARPFHRRQAERRSRTCGPIA